MPIFSSGIDIRRVYVGSIEVQQMFLGSLPVWRRATHVLEAAIGDYALIGFDMLPPFNGELGEFDLTGRAAFFLRSLYAEMESGQFDLTLEDARRISKNITLETGFYTLTRFDADLGAALVVVGEAGSFTLNGEDAEINKTLVLNGVGEFALTGFDTLFEIGRAPIELEPYNIVYRGEDMGIGFSLEAGTFALEGEEIPFPIFVTAEAGEFTFTGVDVTIARGLLLELEAGEFNWIGFEADVEPAATDPDWANVALLHNFESPDPLLDKSTGNRDIASMQGSQVESVGGPFGGAYLDIGSVSGDGARINNVDQKFVFAQGEQFTIEAWHRIPDLEQDSVIFDKWEDVDSTSGCWMIICLISVSGNIYQVWLTTDGDTSGRSVMSYTLPSADTDWHHVVLDRDSNGDVRFYHDGVMGDKLNWDFAMNPPIPNRPLYIGRTMENLRDQGPSNVAEARITVGVARYASDAGFTPPTEPFPTQG